MVRPSLKVICGAVCGTAPVRTQPGDRAAKDKAKETPETSQMSAQPVDSYQNSKKAGGNSGEEDQTGTRPKTGRRACTTGTKSVVVRQSQKASQKFPIQRYGMKCERWRFRISARAQSTRTSLTYRVELRCVASVSSSSTVGQVLLVVVVVKKQASNVGKLPK